MTRQKKNKTLTLKLFETLILRSWWVIIFLILCYIGYDMASKKRDKAIFEMENKYNHLKKERQLALQFKEDLQLHLLSQSDPAWIELVLMKELGVVPENQIKVHFKN